MRPPPLPHQIHVLEQVLERVAAAQEQPVPPLVVFGLDGTLYDNRPRTLHILMEYADEVRDESPDVADALGTLNSERVQYLISDTLRECSLHHAELVRDVTTFWRERFFADEYCGYDVPTAGAPEYVRAIHQAGAGIVYFSGRDVPGMLLGTVASLRDHEFPIAEPGVELVLKPDATLGDEAFKRGSIGDLGRSGEIVGFFDNDPLTCNLAREAYPDAHVVLVETTRIPGSPETQAGIEPASDLRIG